MKSPAKKMPAVKKPAAKTEGTRRGGRRENAGRIAADGATGIITNSVGLMKHHMEFLKRQEGGMSVFIRKFVDKLIERERARAG